VGATVALGILALGGGARVAAARRQLTFARSDLVAARRAMATGDTAGANEALGTARERLTSAHDKAGQFPLGLISGVPVVGSPSRAIAGVADAGLEAVAAGRIMAEAIKGFPTSGTTAVSGEDLSAFHGAATRSLDALRTTEAHLNRAMRDLEGPSGALIPELSGPAKSVRKEIERGSGQLAGARRGLTTLADLSAPDADLRLLLLSQDSLELRPGGGYIGSFGVVHFFHGGVKLERYQESESLPDPSPPLEPPAALAPALPKAWGLSNVNWWPDFPTTAGAAREMFKRQAGMEVDGVIATTDYAIARMVGAVGPLQLPGYAQPVTEQGFAERILYEVELKQPRDVPRKKFLTELAGALFDHMFHLPAERLADLSRAVDRSASAGDFQVWFADPVRQSRIDGTVVDGRLPPPGGDFLMLVDANLSASKANLGLVKEASYRARRDSSGNWHGHLEIAVRNDAGASILNPYYNGFLRVYVPLGSRMKAPGAGQGAEAAADGRYQVFTQLLDIPAHGNQTVTFDYALPGSVEAGGTYHLTWLRQVGTPRDVLTADLGTRTYAVPSASRVLTVAKKRHQNPVRAFLERRWIVRRLGW